MSEQEPRLAEPSSKAVALDPEAKRPRQPGEPHPDAEKVTNARKAMDAEGYAEYKRLERERALRLAVIDTPELSPEDSAYVARLRTKSARGELVCTNLEKAEILALCEMQGLTVSAYLLQLHRHTVNQFRKTAIPDELDAFNLRTEQNFAKVTGDKVLSQLDTELLQGGVPKSNTED